MSDNTTTETIAAFADAIINTTDGIRATLPDGTHAVLVSHVSPDKQWSYLNTLFEAPVTVQLWVYRESVQLCIDGVEINTHGWRCWIEDNEFKIEIPGYGVITLICDRLTPVRKPQNIIPNNTPPVVRVVAVASGHMLTHPVCGNVRIEEPGLYRVHNIRDVPHDGPRD